MQQVRPLLLGPGPSHTELLASITTRRSRRRGQLKQWRGCMCVRSRGQQQPPSCHCRRWRSSQVRLCRWYQGCQKLLRSAQLSWSCWPFAGSGHRRDGSGRSPTCSRSSRMLLDIAKPTLGRQSKASSGSTRTHSVAAGCHRGSHTEASPDEMVRTVRRCSCKKKLAYRITRVDQGRSGLGLLANEWACALLLRTPVLWSGWSVSFEYFARMPD